MAAEFTLHLTSIDQTFFWAVWLQVGQSSSGQLTRYLSCRREKSSPVDQGWPNFWGSRRKAKNLDYWPGLTYWLLWSVWPNFIYEYQIQICSTEEFLLERMLGFLQSLGFLGENLSLCVHGCLFMILLSLLHYCWDFLCIIS